MYPGRKRLGKISTRNRHEHQMKETEKLEKMHSDIWSEGSAEELRLSYFSVFMP